MMSAHRFEDKDLHAWVDGQLDSGRRLLVERWLAEDTEAARRADDYRRQGERLHAAFDHVLAEEPTPGMEALRRALQGRVAANDPGVPSRVRFPAWLRAAAMVAMVAGAAGGGYLTRAVTAPTTPSAAAQRAPLQAFAEEATGAHVFYALEDRFPVEMGADDPGALDSWLSQRMGKAVFGPDLGKVGYRLIGGRSLPSALGVTAQYMYEGDEGKRITLFVGAPHTSQEGKFSFAQRGDIAAFTWIEDGMAYALIGRLSRDELMNITHAVYDDLKAGPSDHRTPTEVPRKQSQPVDPDNPGPVQPAADGQRAKDS
jgi:anti-sigma factor RsiW